MKHLFKKICFLFIFAFLLPNFVFAYVSLVPDSPLGAVANSLDLYSFLKTLYDWGVGIAVALSILFIIFGGIQYMTTDSIFGKKGGKDRIVAALTGLLIALSSWLILNQINPGIFKNNLTLTGLGNLNTTPLESGTPTNTTIPVDNNGNSLDTTTNDGKLNSDSTWNSTGKTSTPVIGDESSIRNSLSQSGVTVNKNPCTYVGQTDCTNTVGFKKSTIDAINTISSGTGGFVITAGTESGHAAGAYSHGTGYKFDIGQGSNSSNWDKIDTYFRSSIGSQNISNNTTYTMTVPSTGQRLDVRRETSGGLHWDIKALP